ncbi:YHS domain-containing protein [Mycetocola manganoxydans]|uniref:YHS domain-containing protein n=1 Tax=Mycetocola manganoxydans TaxID=699879 RepID=A0A3L6ZWA0_9MICO|nr:YHS domain-containing protein [Mycetocola manganoxydans]
MLTRGERIGVTDTIKDGSAAAIADLVARGIGVMMMTGDNPPPRLRSPPSRNRACRRDITLTSGSQAGLATAIDPATMRNIRQKLVTAVWLQRSRHPLAAGCCAAFGVMLSPMIGASATGLSPLSFVSNSYRLRRFTPKLAATTHPLTTDRVVEIVNQEDPKENPMSHQDESPTDNATFVTDPVCGMTIDPKTAAATREHDGARFYFCSAGCAEKFDADPHRYGHPHAAH